MEEDQPCTSKQGTSANETLQSQEAIDPNDNNLNETLEAFAKTYNLSAQNVKNIIFHVVKNPQTMKTLIGKDPEAVATLRMTRSRQKELERISNTKLGIEFKPINPPRTFLDVDYDANEDEDTDYRPEENEEPMEQQQEDDDDSIGFPPESHTDWGTLKLPTNDADDVMPDQLLTNVDDPEYMKFVQSIWGTQAQEDSMFTNEDEDEEYNIIPQELEMDLFEEEEYRMDRTTRIPRWELMALREDVVLPGQENLPAPSRHRFRGISRKASVEPKENDTSNQDNLPAGPSNIAPGEEKEVEIINICADDMSKNKSASLLLGNVAFKEEEVKALKIQMEKHVQLLAQCIVGTYGDQNLLSIRNKAVEMLTELDNEMHARSTESIYQIPNLSDAVYSSHDILACQGVELPPSVRSPSTSEFPYYLPPRNEVMWVFARSSALKYPQLLPIFRFSKFDSLYSTFLPSEQMLLALALYELKHVKHSSWNNWNGRYQLIATNFLPNKSVQQVRNHLKNVRCSTRTTPLHTIIMDAEKGLFNANCILDSEGKGAQNDVPIRWEEKHQPEWLTKLSKLFKQGAIQMVPKSVGTQENPSADADAKSDTEAEIDIVTEDEDADTTYMEEQEDRNEELAEKSTLMDDAMEATPFGGEDTSNEPFPNETIIEPNQTVQADCGNKNQKSRRTLRLEKGLQSLCDPQRLNNSLCALAEAINSDFKQRFFMHQDKLREIQALISRTDLSTGEIFDQLRETLGEQHYHLYVFFTSLLSVEELPEEIQHDSLRLAYRRAWEMLLNFQTYLSGSRSNTSVKNAFRNIKEASECATEEALFNKLKHHFGIRDNPVWRFLRAEMPNEKFTETVEDWEYEFINMDKIQEGDIIDETAVQFETIQMPYRPDPADRGKLRLRHGRIWMEYGGRLRTINIGFTTEGVPSQQNCSDERCENSR
ncbi:hypothetical protein DdX_08874 [Ditylenchus destructor]|uniref:GON-4-like protein n=1 Tax=Ditylenchus destructor TaxID=166010 RepID=A0AAD4R3T5_9BILA|nr:hypothetical protein DdX_08874 [Ditylenchus destructor]